MKKKKVIQYDLTGNKINEFDSTVEAYKSLGKVNIGGNNLSKACRNNDYCYGFKWKYKEDVKINKYTFNEFLNTLEKINIENEYVYFLNGDYRYEHYVLKYYNILNK